jgi:hypothetical protein
VKKTGQTPTPRILLKLHFLALDMNYARHPLVWIYVKIASVCYIIYYRVARYTEQLGTDPKTYVGFFFGILWEYPFYPKVRYSIAAVYSGLIANRLLYSSHFRVGSPTLLRSAIAPIIVYSTLDLVAVYFFIVAFVWFIESRKKIISSVKEDK